MRCIGCSAESRDIECIWSTGFCSRDRKELIAACPQAVTAVCPLSHSLPCLLLLSVFSRIICDHISGLHILPSALHLTALAPLPCPPTPDLKYKPSLLWISAVLVSFLPALCLTLFTTQPSFPQAAAQQQPAAEIVRKALFDWLWAGACLMQNIHHNHNSCKYLITSTCQQIFEGYYLDWISALPCWWV